MGCGVWGVIYNRVYAAWLKNDIETCGKSTIIVAAKDVTEKWKE